MVKYEIRPKKYHEGYGVLSTYDREAAYSECARATNVCGFEWEVVEFEIKSTIN